MLFLFMRILSEEKILKFFYNDYGICALIIYFYCMLIDLINKSSYLHSIELVMLEVNY